MRQLNVSIIGAILVSITFLLTNTVVAEPFEMRVYHTGERPRDRRLERPKNLNDYFPFHVPSSRQQWDERASELRQRILVATGLWPMPDKTPLNAVIHGIVERPGFTVEKVYFESLPKHFVTGLLFRPENISKNAKLPAVLCPHGHGGRLQDYGKDNMSQLIASGAEKFERSGRFPKLARCAQLARMGCVVFIFDMLGYADSVQISRELAHGFRTQRPDFEGKESWGLFSTQAELRMQSVMGLQTWNSVRCLDFLSQLPDVDPNRIAVTGGSGGGTQTILLCAIDSRPIAAFPNGMVSTAMQGGCTCENCCLLRVGTGNVELAAVFAPKPQAMTAADDWTRDMMTKGYPELQQLYAMLGVKDNVYCRPLLHFPHNYNYVSRTTMYSWFNKHMHLGLDEPIEEVDFEPLSPDEYTVWNEDHPRPTGGESYERSLTSYLADQADQELSALRPTDTESLAEFRRVIGGAFRTIIGRTVPATDSIERTKVAEQKLETCLVFKDILRLPDFGEELPVISFFPTARSWNGQVVVWVDGQGKRGMFNKEGGIHPEVQRLLDSGASVLGADLFQQGELLSSEQPLDEQRVVDNPREFAGYTYCYNDTLFARRVHDTLTLVSFASDQEHKAKQIHMIGINGAGPLVAMARAIAGNAVDNAAIDTAGFRFANLTSYRDVNFLPGSVKYGDLPAILALCSPHPLWLAGEKGRIPGVLQSAYAAAEARNAVNSSSSANTTREAVSWLLSL